MRVTPLEIRQKTFEKHFRGYDRDEVNGFLQTLSQEWERIMDENKELRIKLEGAEREVTKLREVETSLYKTLKTAEDTGANVIEQARAAADLHLKESQLKSEEIINEAKTIAKNSIEEAEVRVRNVLAEMEDRLKLLVENYKKLETSREELISELKHLANDTLDRADRARLLISDFDPDKYFVSARRETRRVAFPNDDYVSKSAVSSVRAEEHKVTGDVKEQVVVQEHTVTVESNTKRVQKSFFDEIE